MKKTSSGGNTKKLLRLVGWNLGKSQEHFCFVLCNVLFPTDTLKCVVLYRSDRLWESYIKWESEGNRLLNVTALYDRLLATPTQAYTNHFER